MNQEHNLVIYHANCTDGFGAAFAAWLKLGDSNVEYLPLDYKVNTLSALCNAPNRPINEHTTIYILDFSFPKEVMLSLFKHAKCVVWLDHHKTAFESWLGNYGRGISHEERMENGSEIILDDNRSGAMIAWDYFHGDEHRPMFIRHIDDRDRWQFELNGTKEFHAALRSYEPWSFQQWEEMFAYRDHYGNMITEGDAILRAHEQHVTSISRNAAPCSIEVRTEHEGKHPLLSYLPGLVVNCPPMFSSDVGHELANRSGTFGLCWSLNKDGVNANCSLRSNGDYDVSVIAKKFGGGGHMNAAGFSVPVEQLLSWVNKE